jgi:hypothetical protein
MKKLEESTEEYDKLLEILKANDKVKAADDPGKMLQELSR